MLPPPPLPRGSATGHCSPRGPRAQETSACRVANVKSPFHSTQQCDDRRSAYGPGSQRHRRAGRLGPMLLGGSCGEERRGESNVQFTSGMLKAAQKLRTGRQRLGHVLHYIEHQRERSIIPLKQHVRFAPARASCALRKSRQEGRRGAPDDVDDDDDDCRYAKSPD